jgi:mRNA interferase RelE/StbE
VYTIQFKQSAARELAVLPKSIQQRIKTKIDSLALNPHPPGSAKMEGAGNVYRIRIGDYRVVYSIDRGELIVLVIRVRHRREVYR